MKTAVKQEGNTKRNEEVEAEKQGKRKAVQDQTHLRENKRDEVKLYQVVNSRVKKMKKKKDPGKTGDEGRQMNGWGR